MKKLRFILFTTVLAAASIANADDAPPVKLKLRDPAAATAAPAKGDSTTDPTTGMKFVFVKGGCYQMGSNNGWDYEKPVHEVCVSDFYIGKFEVTQGQWEQIMGNNPSLFKQCGPECPVECISWNAAQDFVKKLNSKSRKQYRLPTEAEWEYAARSGGKNETWSGTNDEVNLGKYAWYEKNSGNVTHKVGLKKANGLGIHDMSGNVSEWCQDWFNEGYYEESPKDNPAGPDNGEKRVVHGGSWLYGAATQRVSDRFAQPPNYMDGLLGVRLVLPAQ